MPMPLDRSYPQTNFPRIDSPSAIKFSRLGQGTAGVGHDIRRRKDEIAALNLGLDLGMCIIDTAERYAAGESEAVVGEAIASRRDDVFLVSKVSPENAGRRDTISACGRSLRRLKTDYLDLYLLHWRETTPLTETIEAFTVLMAEGKIRHWGVSNFDVEDLQEVMGTSGGQAIAANQIMYNLHRRAAEYGVATWCRAQGVAIMAYSPLDQGKLAQSQKLAQLASKCGATPAQIALSWLLRQPGVVPIPEATDIQHVRENHHALNIQLSDADKGTLDQLFPPPSRRVPLDMV